MNTRKLCGTVAAAIFTFALSATASAGTYFECPIDITPENVASEIEDMAFKMRCANFEPQKGDAAPGGWDKDAPVWKWGRKDGCEVHYKLSKLLHVARTSEPPKQTPKNNNDAKGAANDVRDGKLVSALDQLTLLADTMRDNANVADKSQQTHEDDFQTATEAAYLCVKIL